MSCLNARFDGGVVLMTNGEVDASGAYFGAPATIAGASVTSLARADASNLVLSETDLSGCRFLGVHRLEQIRVNGKTRFARHGLSG